MSRIAAFTFAAADRMGTSTSWSEISRCRTASSAKISPGFRYTRMVHLGTCKAWEGKEIPTGNWVSTDILVAGFGSHGPRFHLDHPRSGDRRGGRHPALLRPLLTARSVLPDPQNEQRGSRGPQVRNPGPLRFDWRNDLGCRGISGPPGSRGPEVEFYV